jgi:lysozyme family protein
MSYAFDQAFQHTVGLEGGYVNNPDDKGGETKYGITVAVAREFGYKGSMKDLPLDTAKAIYKKNYWDKLKLDDVSAVSAKVAAEMFDTSVNCGISIAAKFLQRSLNVLNMKQSHWTDITTDGIMGNKTVTALKSFFQKRSQAELVMLRCLNGLQVARYMEITEARENNETFFYGWILNRVD